MLGRSFQANNLPEGIIMSINKLTVDNAYLNGTNKVIPKKIKQETIASSEKLDTSISVDSSIDTDRLAKLDKLAEQIKNKTFVVSPDAIAQKMVEDKDMINLLLN